MEAWLAAVAILLGYLLGSIPSAYILVRLVKGTDIRTVGTGNVGALNTYQQLGTVPAVAVMAVDVGKGVVAVFLPAWLGAPDWARYACAFSVVAGHTWPVFLKFHGGKGAATILGVGLGLAPILAAVSILPVIICVLAIRNVVIGVALAFALFSVLTITLSATTGEPSWAVTGVCLALTVTVVGNYIVKSLPQMVGAIRRRRWRSVAYLD